MIYLYAEKWNKLIKIEIFVWICEKFIKAFKIYFIHENCNTLYYGILIDRKYYLSKDKNHIDKYAIYWQKTKI